MAERLQKVLAQRGLGSRRRCEELIRLGRVTVNGQTAALGVKVDPASDKIRVDGESIPPAEKQEYIILNKPPGVLSSLKGQGNRQTLADLVQVPLRLFPVGRLDVESEGLILLTNDGEAAQRLSHPRYGHEKEYLVLLDRMPEEKQISAWRRGLLLADGYRTRPVQVEFDHRSREGCWFRVLMKEGRKRQIREMAKIVGLSVRRLIRVRIGPIHLGSLKSGYWRRLSRQEVAILLNRVGLHSES